MADPWLIQDAMCWMPKGFAPSSLGSAKVQFPERRFGHLALRGLYLVGGDDPGRESVSTLRARR